MITLIKENKTKYQYIFGLKKREKEKRGYPQITQIFADLRDRNIRINIYWAREEKGWVGDKELV